MKLTNETASQKVYDAAIARFTKAHDLWNGDIEMLTMHTKDYLDLVKIANLIDDDQMVKAMSKMYKLDTEVRDAIPQDVWDHCDKI
jgi:hypothetical protein